MEYTNHITATFLADKSCAADYHVVDAARVSVASDASEHSAEANAGLINYLIKHRHGSPFEHNHFTFLVDAPIFVMREFMRHRIGFSYNEVSGRYTELRNRYYVPAERRNGFTVVRPGIAEKPGGKPGHYEYVDGTKRQIDVLIHDITYATAAANSCYNAMLREGIAKEVARMVLPLNTMTQTIVSCNARSLMSFLSLRQKHDAADAMFPSNPQYEINVIANDMEYAFRHTMPITHRAYTNNKRVAP